MVFLRAHSEWFGANYRRAGLQRPVPCDG